MNKSVKIQALKKILTSVETAEQVMSQQMATITCLKRELNDVLEELGDSSGTRRKVKHELDPALKLKLLGSLTKGAKPFNTQ